MVDSSRGNKWNNKDRSGNSYNKGKIKRIANNHNKNKIDKKSKLETQMELVEKETLSVNIQTSHTEQCKYLPNTNKSNGHIIERLPH